MVVRNFSILVVFIINDWDSVSEQRDPIPWNVLTIRRGRIVMRIDRKTVGGIWVISVIPSDGIFLRNASPPSSCMVALLYHGNRHRLTV